MTYMNFKLMRKYQCSRTNVSSKITTTASWQDVEGSSITYTPADNSDFVIYEFNTNICLIKQKVMKKLFIRMSPSVFSK